MQKPIADARRRSRPSPVALAPSPEVSLLDSVGVDGCRAGWIWVCLRRSGGWGAGVERDLAGIWDRWHQAACILVDIPIGLRDSGAEERLCDLEARRAIGPQRSSSVFPVPCRPALSARGYGEACRVNQRRTGRRLSRQSWNIAAKIREVDALLRFSPEARRVVRETHPEVLFWALNGGQAMQHNKRTEGGFKERLGVVTRHYPGAKTIVDSVLNSFARKDVGKDDVLDALAAVVTATLARGSFRSFPERPEQDSAGLPMEIVYCRP